MLNYKRPVHTADQADTTVQNFVPKWSSAGVLSSTGHLIDDGTDITVVAANLIFDTVGKGLLMTEGVNGVCGVVDLIAGEATVATTKVTGNSRVFITAQTDGGTPGWLRVDTRSSGVSFHILSSSATDTSTVAWMIVEPTS